MMDTFKFWCYKVLPLVYDDSLSYYEVLCKVVKYINELIEQDKIFGDELAQLESELESVQAWIDSFNYDFAEKVISDYLATMIFVEITDAGYIVFNIPQTWKDIKFNTTGLDIEIPGVNEFGKLVLSY